MVQARRPRIGPRPVNGSYPVTVAPNQPAIPVVAELDTTGLATEAKQDAAIGATQAVRDRLPTAFTGGGGVKAGLVDALPAGTATIGSVGTALSATPKVGQTTSNTSAVQLSAVSTPAVNGVIVRALSTNNEPVFVGGVGVTSITGFELVAGESASFAVTNITALYVVGANASDGVCWNVL